MKSMTMVPPRRAFHAAAIAIALAGLAACGSKITPETFARVESGMTESRVVDIMGRPTSAESGSFLGMTGTQYVYERGKDRCVIMFFDGKVIAKNATFGAAPQSRP
jgi:hypothetical protein